MCSVGLPAVYRRADVYQYLSATDYRKKFGAIVQKSQGPPKLNWGPHFIDLNFDVNSNKSGVPKCCSLQVPQNLNPLLPVVSMPSTVKLSTNSILIMAQRHSVFSAHSLVRLLHLFSSIFKTWSTCFIKSTPVNQILWLVCN